MENINTTVEEREIKKQPIRPVMKTMEVDQVVKFPLHQYRTVTSACTDLKDAFEWDFTTSKNRKDKVVEVKRIA